MPSFFDASQFFMVSSDAPGGHKKVADPTKRIGSAVALGIIPISLLI